MDLELTQDVTLNTMLCTGTTSCCIIYWGDMVNNRHSVTEFKFIDKLNFFLTDMSFGLERIMTIRDSVVCLHFTIYWCQRDGACNMGNSCRPNSSARKHSDLYLWLVLRWTGDLWTFPGVAGKTCSGRVYCTLPSLLYWWCTRIGKSSSGKSGKLYVKIKWNTLLCIILLVVDILVFPCIWTSFHGNCYRIFWYDLGPSL